LTNSTTYSVSNFIKALFEEEVVMKTFVIRLFVLISLISLSIVSTLSATTTDSTLYGLDLTENKIIVSFYKVSEAPEEVKKWGRPMDFSEYGEAYLLTRITDYSDGDGRERTFSWRDKFVSDTRWEEWENLFRIQIHKIHSQPPLEQKNEQENEKSVKIDKYKAFQIVRIGSGALKDVQKITSILYTISPNEITAAGAVISDGFVFFDTLGGNKGVTVISAIPFTTATLIIPNDPKTFFKNAINPISVAAAGINASANHWDTVKESVKTARKSPLRAVFTASLPIIGAKPLEKPMQKIEDKVEKTYKQSVVYKGFKKIGL
jgi:hypothetical protein